VCMCVYIYIYIIDDVTGKNTIKRDRPFLPTQHL